MHYSLWVRDFFFLLGAFCFLEGDVKMSSFSITRKKTPFQKHREEEEAKKKVWLLINSVKLDFDY